jgi:glycosyltransferase involved in cell wall biosynthesis
MRRIRLALVTPAAAKGVTGGAERLYRGLVRALNSGHVSTDQIELPVDESSFESIIAGYLGFYDLDLTVYDGVISTKAPSYMVRHRNHVCYLLHTIRVFYDMFDREFLSPWPELHEQRAFVQRADTMALSAPHTKEVFVIGGEVADRLQRFNGLSSTVLHPPMEFDKFQFQQGDRGYAFIPGRLHRWKRIDLIIRSMKFVQAPMELLIAGTGEDEPYLRELAADDQRIRFLGRVTDSDLVTFYGNARVVPFTPVEEDYGYITLEAFQSGKPVITCVDSGEPARMVRDGVSGFVVKPDPAEIGERLQYVYEHPAEAREMGKHGAESIRHIQWQPVRTRLLSALGF